VTIDIDPLVKRDCPKGGMVMDARDLRAFGDKQFGAVFVGSVFESIDPGLRQAVREAARVADEMFVHHIDARSLSAEWHPETRNVIYVAPPTAPYVAWRRHGTELIETELVP